MNSGILDMKYIIEAVANGFIVSSNWMETSENGDIDYKSNKNVFAVYTDAVNFIKNNPLILEETSAKKSQS